MAGIDSPRRWLDRALPVIRVIPVDRSFIGRRLRVIAVYRDRLVVMWVREKTRIPEAAYEPNGIDALRSLKSARGRVEVPIDSITRVRLGWWGFTVETGRRKLTFGVPKGEEPNVVRAFQELLGDRFDRPPDRPAAQSPGRAQPVRRPPDTPPRDPERSRRDGPRWMVIGLALIFLALCGGMVSVGILEEAGVPGGFRLLAWIAWAFLIVYGFFCLDSGRRLRLPDARQVLASDPRRPIVYLRSFSHDDLPGLDRRGSNLGVQAQLGFIFHLLALQRRLRGREGMTLEQEFALIFRDFGPFVAIGKPGESLPPLGAARQYTDDDSWKAIVLDLLERAQLVVLKVGLSEGTWWEFTTCLRRVEPTRLLLVLPFVVDPANVREAEAGPQQQYEEFRLRAAAEGLPVSLPRSVFGATFLHFDRDGTPHLLELRYRPRLLWPFVDSILDLRRSLRAFLARAGAARSPGPTVSRAGRSRSPSWLAAAAVAVAVTGAIAWYATDTGEITIELDDPDAVVSIDGDVIPGEALARPLTLRAGTHKLVARRGNFVALRQEFEVRRGAERSLPVEVAAIDDPAIWEGEPCDPLAEQFQAIRKRYDPKGEYDPAAKAETQLNRLSLLLLEINLARFPLVLRKLADPTTELTFHEKGRLMDVLDHAGALSKFESILDNEVRRLTPLYDNLKAHHIVLTKDGTWDFRGAALQIDEIKDDQDFKVALSELLSPEFARRLTDPERTTAIVTADFILSPPARDRLHKGRIKYRARNRGEPADRAEPARGDAGP